MIEPMLSEMREEAAISKRVLERIPADKLSWKPHPKSMSLGELAFHVASVPGNLTKVLQLEEFEPNFANFNPPLPKNLDEILATFDQGTRAAEEFLSDMDERTALGKWRVKAANGREVLCTPRIAAVRSIMLIHCYHHRGQLSVYLRLLDVQFQ
ncbi:MAG: DinB family protein [Candidatus Acidiferrales bacterium]|jgi:uncharacterized damage-inducible protein DinB